MNKQISYTEKIPFFNVPVTLDCGQAFRWKKDGNGDMHGVAFSRALTVHAQGDKITFYGTDKEEFNRIWRRYFDLDRDYEGICRGFGADEKLKSAVEAYPGIRILRQEPWEALVSFIISQNNNIPRIKGIIERLCETLGDDLGDCDFSFPSPEKILAAGQEGLAPLRAGFRAKYIIDAAEKVASGEVDFAGIEKLDLESAAQELKKIKGVGDKVAACALLYGFGRVDALPVDVWVKRILETDYPGGLPACTDGVKGIAQQYLFHWKRNCGV